MVKSNKASMIPWRCVATGMLSARGSAVPHLSRMLPFAWRHRTRGDHGSGALRCFPTHLMPRLASRLLAAMLAMLLSAAPAIPDPMEPENPANAGRENGLRFLSFELAEDGVYYMPVGTHFSENDIFFSNLIGITKGPVSFAVYRSTLGGHIYTLMQGREVFSYRGAGADVFYGIMHGYDGALTDSERIPGAVLPLFEGPINPVLALSPYVAISRKFEARGMLTPGFLALGIKYRF